MEIKLTGQKAVKTKKLIYDMLDILGMAGIPLTGSDRRLERMAMACLAVGRITGSINQAASSDDGAFMTTREIIKFENEHYGENISQGSYDDIRRKDLLMPVQAGIVVNSASLERQSTNNPTRGYALSKAFVCLLKQYGTVCWDAALEKYKSETELLAVELEHRRNLAKIPVVLPSGKELKLTPGEHNALQKAVIEEFLPRFGMGAEVLYVGDTSDKDLFIDRNTLDSIGFFALEHEELPDVVAYNREKNLLFLVEAVHSTGPMSEMRVRKLARQLESCKAVPVYVTAFLDKKVFRKWVTDIAWESEVWIADSPEHMIHFNGYKFLEIHK